MAGRGNGSDERLRKQREYQRDYRRRMKKAKVQYRDEIARELLHYAITENLKRGRESELWALADAVIERLAARGYDREATGRAFVGTVDRYEDGWDFQRRVHLLAGADEGAADEGGR